MGEGTAAGGLQGAGSAASALRTFLIADVRGYTRYTQEQGDEEAARLAARFAELARRGIESHGGELLELRGDEALGVFTSAREALRAAVGLQRLFRERTDGTPALALGVGIGLDAGEAVPVEGGYRGGALNLAARLCSRAAPGEILTSETVVSLARRIEGIRFEERGVERLKGLDAPVRVIEVVSETALPPVPVSRWASLRRLRRKHVTRGKTWAVAGMTVVSVAAALLAVVALGGTVEGREAPTRAALVISGGTGDAFELTRQGFLRAARTFDLETEIIGYDDTSPEALGRTRTRIADGDFDLLIWAGEGHAAEVRAGEIAKNEGTHWVVPGEVDGARMSNATGVVFLGGSASYLAGYLSALVSKTGRVSVIGAFRDVYLPLVQGFKVGAKAARPAVDVRVDYSDSWDDQAKCERIANRQIDAGSDVVFAAALQCGLGAMSAAGIRGVRGVGVDSDQSYLGAHILASVVTRFDRAVELIVQRYLEGALPAGETV